MIRSGRRLTNPVLPTDESAPAGQQRPPPFSGIRAREPMLGIHKSSRSCDCSSAHFKSIISHSKNEKKLVVFVNIVQKTFLYMYSPYQVGVITEENRANCTLYARIFRKRRSAKKKGYLS